MVLKKHFAYDNQLFVGVITVTGYSNNDLVQGNGH